MRRVQFLNSKGNANRRFVFCLKLHSLLLEAEANDFAVFVMCVERFQGGG